MKNYPLNKAPLYITFREMMEDISKKYAENTAYSFRVKPTDAEPVRISFTQLGEDVRCLCTSLCERGLQSSHVALIGKLTYPWVCTYLSLLAIGAVIVPLDAEWTGEDLVDTMLRGDCDALFCSTDVLKNKIDPVYKRKKLALICELDGEEGDDVFSALLAEGRDLREAGDRRYETTKVNPDSLSMLAFTSGTTGKGKGVMLTQTAILSDVWGGLSLLTLYKKTIALLPPHHTFGSNLNLVAHLMYGTEVYLSSGIRYLLRELKEEKPQHMALVPLFLESFQRKIIEGIKEKKMEKDFARFVKLSNSLRKTGVDMRRKFFKGILNTFGGELRLVVCGGAPLNQSLIEFFDHIGITVLNGYGITECAPVLAVNRNLMQKAGSVGQVLPNDTIKILDPNEKGEGEICVKGPNVMLGYYKDEEATDAAFDADGYFRTGDIGTLDSEGWLYITGRAKNIIILSNGKNVYPEEIEAAFSGVPGIGEIVVYEGVSARGNAHNTIVAEIFPTEEYLEKGADAAHAHFYPYIQNYNRTAVPYKKVGLLKIRTEDFPKNTLRKIMRFKIDRNID